MRAQVNLDFLMKFFISVVAVALLILSLYYFGSQFAQFFGVDFKLKPPGVNGGNLNFKFKINSESNSVIDNNTCVTHCNEGLYGKYAASDCKSFCNSHCDAITESCVEYKYGVIIFVPSGDDVTFRYNISNEYTLTRQVFAGENKFTLAMLLPGSDSGLTIDAKLIANYKGIEVNHSVKVYNPPTGQVFSFSLYNNTNGVQLSVTNSSITAPFIIRGEGTFYDSDHKNLVLTCGQDTITEEFPNATVKVYKVDKQCTTFSMSGTNFTFNGEVYWGS